MRRITRTVAALAAVSAIGVGGVASAANAACYGNTSGAGGGGQAAAVPGATISTAVAQELAFMVQEEKLARDVYALAASLYPDRIFTTINRSESTHMAALRVLLDRYDVADPTAGAKPGVFADDDLQALYTKLAAQVRVSRDQAVQAGILVEVADIADLKDALTLKAPSDVRTVLGNLLAGSQRHLAAFQRNA